MHKPLVGRSWTALDRALFTKIRFTEIYAVCPSIAACFHLFKDGDVVLCTGMKKKKEKTKLGLMNMSNSETDTWFRGIENNKKKSRMRKK